LNTPILTLREAIIQRVHDKSQEDLTDIIEGSIGNDERTLPGLGVLFELIWQDSDTSLHHQLVETLHTHLTSTPPPLQGQK
jgi:small acid-soluble spore protein I (minor)